MEERKSVRSIRRTCAVALMLAMVGVVGCSPQSADPDADSADAPAASEQGEPVEAEAEFAWSADSDCATCHEDAVASFSDSACVASKHSQFADSCETCHNDEAGLQKAHEKVKADSRKKSAKLKRTEIGREVCLPCHDEAGLAQATAESTVLTDAEGVVVNPHDVPSSESHDALNCSDCHKQHAGEGVAETAPQVCKNCHHDNVYQCGTCHD